MAAVDEIRSVLEQYGPPAPSLLPWAATWVAERDLLLVARTAAAQAELTPFRRWPVVADAVAEVLARRTGAQSALISQLVEVLPPIAGYLPPPQAAVLVRASPRADALGYALLANRARPTGLVGRVGPQWEELLLAASYPVPPLANFRLLVRLVAGPTWEPGDLLGSEVAYLLPFEDAGHVGRAWTDPTVAEIEDRVPSAMGWYPAALLARAAPFLDQGLRLRVRGSAGEAPPAWAGLLRDIAEHAWAPWRSAAAELAASHPAMPMLAQLPQRVSRAELAAVAGDITRRVFAEYGDPALERWEPSTPEPGSFYLIPPTRIIDADWAEPGQVRLSVPEDLADLAAPPAWPDRHVNVVLGLVGNDQPVPDGHVYQADTSYELLVGIGRPVAGSLLPGDESRWPDELLPSGGLWLQAALALPAGATPVVCPIYLPAEGESFTCDCPFGSEHNPGCGHRRWARFPVPAVEDDETLTGELVIYYGAAAVVAIGIRLSAGEVVRSGTTAKLLGRLSSTFADLDMLAERSASIVSLRDQNQLMVNGATILDKPLAIAAAAADGIALNARTALYDMHFEVKGGELVSRLEPSFGKNQHDYESDLRRLAELGAGLFTGLFNSPGSDNEAAYALPSLVRHEAQVRGRPPMLQIIDQSFGDRAVPWALIYDLPVGSDTSGYVLCPSVRDFGPAGGRDADPPVNCPHAHDETDDVLCPYGFWGLSCVIEQPVLWSPVGQVVCGDQRPLSWLVVTDPGMTDDTVTGHLARLRVSPAGVQVSQPSLGTATQLAAELALESMDVVYFYCHSGYVTGHPEAPANRYLKLGTFNVQPLDVARWARGWYRYGPNPHWPSRRPLVVLNGCHTAEFTSGTLNNFASAFVQVANAAGVVGTEITVEQGFAGWVGEELLALLAGGLSVGEALHRLRWALLRRGNMLGLAYTPFCLANLTLRPVVKD